jgi:hypothetical protein
MLKKILMTSLMASFVLLAGCPSTPEEIVEKEKLTQARNEASIANPEQVGVLPDGRAVNRIRTWVQGEYYAHYVYFIDSANVSTNYSVRSGKTTFNQTNIALPSNPTTDEVIALAEKLKQEQKSADEAEFARLKQKLGQ